MTIVPKNQKHNCTNEYNFINNTIVLINKFLTETIEPNNTIVLKNKYLTETIEPNNTIVLMNIILSITQLYYKQISN